MKQVITNIETKCDICGAEISSMNYDVSPMDKMCHFVSTVNMSLTCTLELSVFNGAHQIKDICSSCKKEILTQILSQEQQFL